MGTGKREAKFENVIIEKTCVKCNGDGFHHGFGEHGHDPDWCTECGGSGVSFESKESEGK